MLSLVTLLVLAAPPTSPTTLLFSEAPLSFRHSAAYTPVVKTRATANTPLHVQVPLGGGSQVSIQVFEGVVPPARFDETLRTDFFPTLTSEGIKVDAKSWSGLTRTIAGRERSGKRWAGRLLKYSFFLESFVFSTQGRTVWVLFTNNFTVPEYEAAFREIAETLLVSQRPAA